MREDAVSEIRRRSELIIKNSKPNDMRIGMSVDISGSLGAFTTSLNLLGGFSGNPLYTWMSHDDYTKPVLNPVEYQSGEYDDLIRELFEKAYREVNNIK